MHEGEKPAWGLGPFVKEPEPVLRPDPASTFDCPIEGRAVHWERQNVYNPAAVVREGRLHFLYRADDGPKDTAWGRTCRLGLARSGDGRHFTRNGVPVVYPDNDEFRPYEWDGGCEDLHIIEGEDGAYYMNYTTWNGTFDTMSVATSRDLVHWRKYGPAFAKSAPERVRGSRSGVVVAELRDGRLVAAKLRGKYWMYYTHPCALASSDDLIHWTPTGEAVWPQGDREAGACALLRNDGILLMTQGSHPTLGEWVIRQALLSRDNLTTVLEEQQHPIVYPEYDWETHGFVPRTTVANTLVPFGDRWHLYYGAADHVVGLATCAIAI